eukprot:UN1915
MYHEWIACINQSVPASSYIEFLAIGSPWTPPRRHWMAALLTMARRNDCQFTRSQESMHACMHACCMHAVRFIATLHTSCIAFTRSLLACMSPLHGRAGI